MNLPQPHLRVTADEPGRLLVLEHEKIALPAFGRGLVMGLVEVAGAAESEQWWRPRRIRADRAQGVLAIDDVQILQDQERQESIDLADVVGLTVRMRYVAPPGKAPAPSGPGNARHVDAIVRVGGGRGERTLSLQVEGVDTREKVADLALRLGAVMGLRYQRVAVSDPRRIEIEIASAAAAGLEAIAPPEARADYARGVVGPSAARLTREWLMPPLDVPRFPAENPITRWAPGNEVRFDKPLAAGMVFGCLPVALAFFLLGPALWLGYHDVVATLIGTLMGLLFGAVAAGMALMSLPRHVRISWGERTITVRGALRGRRVPFDRIEALELRCVRQYLSGSRGRNSYNTYECVVDAMVREGTAGPTAPVMLVSTRSFKREPETPYDAALPLTKDLAGALGVEWRVKDYN